MNFNPLLFLIGKTLAEKAGTTPERANQLGLISSVLNTSVPMAIVTTKVIADNEAASSSPPVVAPTPTEQGITLPDVKMMLFTADQGGAKERLMSLGLQVTSQEEPNDQYPEGIVVAQVPEPGTTVAANSIVTLTISQSTKVEVPDVVGESAQEAQNSLQAEGLRPEVYPLKLEGCSSEQAKVVLFQFPLAGEKVVPNSQIILFIPPE